MGHNKEDRDLKTYLITGGTGFIGSALAIKLLKEGNNVVVFDNNERGKSLRLLKYKKKIKLIKGDIRNINELNKAMKNIDVVCHLAYINGTKFFYKKPEKVIEIAIKGIINVIDCCINNKIKNLILASSSEVYQDPEKIPTSEKERLIIPDIYNPRYSYGGGKILTELMGIIYGKKYFKKLIIFRPHNVYGPDMGNEHVIPEFFNKIFKLTKSRNKNLTLDIQGSGLETRAFIYIDDFIDGLYKIIKKGKHLEIYNIGTNEEVSINHLALKISKLFNIKINIKNKALAKGSTKRRCPDIKKIAKLNFKQKIKLQKGLLNYYKWFRKI